MTFWVIPYRLIAFIIVVLIVGYFLFRNFIRRYNRTIIKRSQNRR
jgi:Kef-type K+ transport system membrane component KefB